MPNTAYTVSGDTSASAAIAADRGSRVPVLDEQPRGGVDHRGAGDRPLAIAQRRAVRPHGLDRLRHFRYSTSVVNTR